MVAVGQSLGMVPDFSKAKNAAIRIMRLNKRQSKINPYDESGIILVGIHFMTGFYFINNNNNNKFLFII